MSKSAIFDKAMDYIDDHIELTKQEIRVGIYEYFRYDTTKISTFITILTGSLSLDQYITNHCLQLKHFLSKAVLQRIQEWSDKNTPQKIHMFP